MRPLPRRCGPSQYLCRLLKISSRPARWDPAYRSRRRLGTTLLCEWTVAVWLAEIQRRLIVCNFFLKMYHLPNPYRIKSSVRFHRKPNDRMAVHRDLISDWMISFCHIAGDDKEACNCLPMVWWFYHIFVWFVNFRYPRFISCCVCAGRMQLQELHTVHFQNFSITLACYKIVQCFGSLLISVFVDCLFLLSCKYCLLCTIRYIIHPCHSPWKSVFGLSYCKHFWEIPRLVPMAPMFLYKIP